MRRSVTLSALLTVALAAASAVETALAVDSLTGDPKFAMRADPARAKDINSYLQQVARPSQAAIPKGMTIDAFLKDRCGSAVPNQNARTAIRHEGEHGDLLQFTPCLRIRTTVAVNVKSKDTLETIARRLGLNPTSASRLDRFRGSFPNLRRLKKEERLREGDTVIAPHAPQWTVFETERSKVPDFIALVKQLARVLHCRDPDAEECLFHLDVVLLEQHAQPSIDDDSAATSRLNAVHWPPEWSNALQSVIDPAVLARSHVAGALPAASSATAALDVPAAAAPPPTVASGVFVPTGAPIESALAAPAAAAPTPPASTVVAAITPPAPLLPFIAGPVLAPSRVIAEGQWPYDAELIKLTLAAAIKAHPGITPTVVGIADGGLADSSGRPLPQNVFTTVPGEIGDGYPGDTIGAGVERIPQPATGDVGLCPSQSVAPTISRWSPETFIIASHGTIAASVAAGLPLRADPTLQGVLPALTFFRLSASDCSTSPDLNFQPQAVYDAITYLNTRALIINVSYISTSRNQMFPDSLKSALAGQERLLIVPAGNSAVDLDSELQCPPCLTNANWRHYDAVIGSHILVVGAATSDLRRAPFSGSGKLTVHLYAPAEPIGALDILGGDAGSYAPATSYAAPYAALAAALMRSLGIDDLRSITHRMMAASWPLVEDGGDGNPFHYGVIDMTKVAAVRSYAVEVLEKTVAGSLVRRTYVGQLSQKLDHFSICPGALISEGTVQAVRFGMPDANGDRPVTIYLRNPDKAPQQFPKCHPTDPLTIVDLKAGRFTFPMDSVTEILVPWAQ